MTFREKYIGDRKFYKHALAIALPMIVQNMITTFVSMLDNIMVGQIGTAEMSGVSIVNQFIFIFNLTLFGGLSGASIFGAQFYGKQDYEGQKYTFRFRLVLAAIIVLVFALIFGFFQDPLIRLFLSTDDSPAIIQATLSSGKTYMGIMIISMIPFAIGQAYASTLRECGETRVPMIAAFAAVGVNLFLDYALIFGKFGFPCLGVAGAAIATVLAKTIEASYMVIWTHAHTSRIHCMAGVYRGFYMPGYLVADIIKRGCPLLANEFLWSLGMSVIAQCYSVRGIDVVAARNIASTLSNLFGVVYVQLGACTGIIVGALLGAGELEKARDTDNKMIVFSMIFTIIVAIIMLPISFLFPDLYNTEEEVRSLATYFLLITCGAMPIWSYTNSCYFTLRCGGKTGITFLFDFVFTYFVMIPVAFVLTRFTNWDIHVVIPLVTYSELLKVVVGYLLVRSDLWIVNLVDKE